MTKFMFNNRTDASKTDVNLLNVRNAKKKIGNHQFVLGRTCSVEHLNLENNWASLSRVVKLKTVALRSLKGIGKGIAMTVWSIIFHIFI